MAQFIEFLTNHPILVGCWLAAFAAIVFYHQRTGAKGVSPAQAITLINRSEAVIVDVRDKKDFDEGHIVDAMHMPSSKVAQRVTELQKHKGKPIIVACKLGQQSGETVKALEAEGHEAVFKLVGGMTEWRAQSLPVVTK